VRDTTRKSSLASPWFWLGVIALSGLDLWTKSWAWQFLGQGIQPVAGTWLGWQTIYNPGGIFGMGQNFTVALTVVRVFAVALILVLVHRQARNNCIGLVTLTLLVAGAIGNLYDNLSTWLPWAGNGQVRDFIRVYFESPGWWPTALPWPFSPWPIFNLADSFICVGFLLLVSGLAAIKLEAGEAAGEEGE